MSCLAESVAFPAALWGRMLAQARAEAPFEACGLVVGGADGHPRRYHPLRNAAGRLDWFEPDPLELLRVTLAIEDAGETLWGIYHSHPRAPARPSASDIAGANYPDSIYLIASLQNPARPVLRAFWIAAGTAVEVPLSLAE